MPRIRNIVGPQVRRLRVERDWSQPALAVMCQKIGWDIARDTIAKIEGQTRWVSDAELVILARCFKVSLEALVPLSPTVERLALAVLTQ